MAQPRLLWAASFSAPPDAAEILSPALEEGALSLATVAPPRTGRAEVEAIYGHEPDAADLNARLAILASIAGIKPPKLTVRALPKLDWLKKVSEDFPPLVIGRWVVFGAQHKAAAARHHKIPLQIDATSAFGTGEHPTTRGCLLMLDWWLKNETLQARRAIAFRNMADIGCGSGILAMAYCTATHGRAFGVDLDADSVRIARDNIRANGLRAQMRAELGNGYRAATLRANSPYDLIMANIFAGPLCKLAYDLKKNLRHGGTAILSGLLTHQANRVISAHRMQGLALLRHIRLGEWSVLAFVKN